MPPKKPQQSKKPVAKKTKKVKSSRSTKDSSDDDVEKGSDSNVLTIGERLKLRRQQQELDDDSEDDDDDDDLSASSSTPSRRKQQRTRTPAPKQPKAAQASKGKTTTSKPKISSAMRGRRGGQQQQPSSSLSSDEVDEDESSSSSSQVSSWTTTTSSSSSTSPTSSPRVEERKRKSTTPAAVPPSKKTNKKTPTAASKQSSSSSAARGGESRTAATTSNGNEKNATTAATTAARKSVLAVQPSSSSHHPTTTLTNIKSSFASAFAYARDMFVPPPTAATMQPSSAHPAGRSYTTAERQDEEEERGGGTMASLMSLPQTPTTTIAGVVVLPPTTNQTPGSTRPTSPQIGPYFPPIMTSTSSGVGGVSQPISPLVSIHAGWSTINPHQSIDTLIALPPPAAHYQYTAQNNTAASTPNISISAIPPSSMMMMVDVDAEEVEGDEEALQRVWLSEPRARLPSTSLSRTPLVEGGNVSTTMVSGLGTTTTPSSPQPLPAQSPPRGGRSSTMSILPGSPSTAHVLKATSERVPEAPGTLFIALDDEDFTAANEDYSGGGGLYEILPTQQLRPSSYHNNNTAYAVPISPVGGEEGDNSTGSGGVNNNNTRLAFRREENSVAPSNGSGGGRSYSNNNNSKGTSSLVEWETGTVVRTSGGGQQPATPGPMSPQHQNKKLPPTFRERKSSSQQQYHQSPSTTATAATKKQTSLHPFFPQTTATTIKRSSFSSTSSPHESNIARVDAAAAAARGHQHPQQQQQQKYDKDSTASALLLDTQLFPPAAAAVTASSSFLGNNNNNAPAVTTTLQQQSLSSLRPLLREHISTPTTGQPLPATATTNINVNIDPLEETQRPSSIDGVIVVAEDVEEDEAVLIPSRRNLRRSSHSQLGGQATQLLSPAKKTTAFLQEQRPQQFDTAVVDVASPFGPTTTRVNNEDESPGVSRHHITSSFAVTTTTADLQLHLPVGNNNGRTATTSRGNADVTSSPTMQLLQRATADIQTASSLSVARSLPHDFGRGRSSSLQQQTTTTTTATNTTTHTITAPSDETPVIPAAPSKNNNNENGDNDSPPTPGASPSSSFAITERRPVDDALQGLFPATFTKAQFLSDAVRVVKDADGYCFTEKGEQEEFWEAFETVEYVGEGSFGLVWKCKTVSGDVVAVKSCPVSFACPESIDDAYSLLREVSIMVFLNKMKVPYVPPLHGSFFTNVSQALPGPVRLATEAAIAVDEQKDKVDKVKLQLNKKRAAVREKVAARWAKAKKGNKKASSSTTTSAVVGKKRQRSSSPGGGQPHPPQSPEEETERLLSEEVEETPEVQKLLIRYEADVAKLEALKATVATLQAAMTSKMPKYSAIDKEAALCCDATIFLVTDLCDGDLESIDRSEAVTKRVAFCISTALASIHRLGLVHLDLKPANILYAFDRSTPPGGNNNNNSQQQHVAVKFILSDFGNCQIVGRSYSDTIHPSIGTYEYMDFETLSSRTSSRATDCFSLGATLFELTTGKRYIKGCCKGGGGGGDDKISGGERAGEDKMKISCEPLAPLLFKPLAIKRGRGGAKKTTTTGKEEEDAAAVARPRTPPCREGDRHTPRSCYAPHFLRHKLRCDTKGIVEHLSSLHLLDPTTRLPPKNNNTTTYLSTNNVVGSISSESLSSKESQAFASVLRGATDAITTTTSRGNGSKLGSITASAVALGTMINGGFAGDLPDVAHELSLDGYAAVNSGGDLASAVTTTTAAAVSSSSSPPGNVMSTLITGLLHHDRGQRMTAAGCRLSLMAALAVAPKRPPV